MANEFQKARIVREHVQLLAGNLESTSEEAYITDGRTVLKINQKTYQGHEQIFYARIKDGQAIVTRIE